MKDADHHEGSSRRQLAGNPHHSRGPHTIKLKGPGGSSSRFKHNAGGISSSVGGGTFNKHGRKGKK